MTDYEPFLNRWQSAGVLDADSAGRIRAWESAQQALQPAMRVPEQRIDTRESGLAWQGRVALILGGILLASGIILFVSSLWDQLGPSMRYLLVVAMVTVFLLGGAIARD